MVFLGGHSNSSPGSREPRAARLWHEAMVFENDRLCMLSREPHTSQKTGQKSYGWILGQDLLLMHCFVLVLGNGSFGLKRTFRWKEVRIRIGPTNSFTFCRGVNSEQRVLRFAAQETSTCWWTPIVVARPVKLKQTLFQRDSSLSQGKTKRSAIFFENIRRLFPNGPMARLLQVPCLRICSCFHGKLPPQHPGFRVWLLDMAS